MAIAIHAPDAIVEGCRINRKRFVTLGASLVLACLILMPAAPAAAEYGSASGMMLRDTEGATSPYAITRTAHFIAMSERVAQETGMPLPVLRVIIDNQPSSNPSAFSAVSGITGAAISDARTSEMLSIEHDAEMAIFRSSLRSSAVFLMDAYTRWGSWDMAFAAYALGDPDVTAHPFPTEYVQHVRTALTTAGVAVEPDQRGSIALSHAMEQHGAPYVAGGSSPDVGFDCSGLVSWAYRQLGIQIPRDGASQWDATSRIDASELRPGDIVFFASDGYIFHVGIYAGNGVMLHAPNSGDSVSYASLSEPYWVTYLAGYGRVL